MCIRDRYQRRVRGGLDLGTMSGLVKLRNMRPQHAALDPMNVELVRDCGNTPYSSARCTWLQDRLQFGKRPLRNSRSQRAESPQPRRTLVQTRVDLFGPRRAVFWEPQLTNE
eukprot:TRINITY_DN43_c0_g1_i2.p1 TRINITY_DN43_c0_g1~~TRINITY_DN43_c0_g1_i2.p1  ORF type:complete len:112 (+),score=4.39 TRINITY_DN43_c0_g1_i2:152-487(+)